jgi:hypothetical protein
VHDTTKCGKGGETINDKDRKNTTNLLLAQVFPSQVFPFQVFPFQVFLLQISAR